MATTKIAYRQNVVELQLHHGLLPVDNSLHDVDILAIVFTKGLLSGKNAPTPKIRRINSLLTYHAHE